ncbi:MAG: hypothetical protein ABIF01_01850 [Candidatus Micrarchaeota archaeon]
MSPEESKALTEELQKQVGEQRLEELIQEKEEKFHGLLTREAAIYAISKEMNIRSSEKPISVSEVGPQTRRATVTGRVSQIFEVKRFEKNGKQGRVCRVFLADEKAERALVLWNVDVDYLEKGKVLKDDLIEVRGAYVKGDELQLGYGGSIALLERKPEKSITELSDGEPVSLTASILEYSGLRRYERDGVTHEMGSCMIDDGSSRARLVLWEPNERALEGAKRGDSVRLDGARMKNGEVQTTRASRIALIQKPIPPGQITSDFEGEVEGKIEEVKVRGKGLLLKLSGGEEIEFLLNNELSLRLLKLKSLPDDVSLETMLSLKGGPLMGSAIRMRGKAIPEEGELVFHADKLLS